MKKNKKYEIIFFLFLLVLLFRANLVFALEINYPPVPGVEPPQVFLEKIENGEPGYEPEKALPLYIKYFYSLFLTISGVAAFIAIVFGGFLYLVSVGSPAKMKNARDQISTGILGLIILLSSYLILTTINPQLTIFHISKQGITPSGFHKECVEGTGKCLPAPGAGPDECSSDADCPEEGKDVYVEIPLGWLIERVKAKAEIAEDQAEDVWYVGAENSIETHTSLEELAKCLNKLIQRCRCDRATEECPSELDDSECPEGTCRDPCDRCLTTNPCEDIYPSLDALCAGIQESVDPLLPCPDECNLRLVINAKRDELDSLTAQLLMEREDAIIVKGILERELVKLKLAEALMRDSFYPPISYHNFAAIEEATSRTLEIWENAEAVRLARRSEATSPHSCRINLPGYEITPSCDPCPCDPSKDNLCDYTGEFSILFCYGNIHRLDAPPCETDDIIPDGEIPFPGDKWFGPDEFAGGIVHYNGGTFIVPDGGVTVCNTIAHHCDDPRCKQQGIPGVGIPLHIPDDPANFYVREKGNEDLIAAIERLDITLPLPDPEFWVSPLPPLDPADVLPVELYCQNNPSWGGIRLGTGEPVYYMSRYGCNLTSFAMILRYLGFSYDPGDIANFVNENNLWHGGVSNRNLFDIFKEKKSLSYNFQEISSDKISEELNDGHPIFTGCANFDANGYTHWIVIKGIVEEEGTTYIYIGDPYCGWVSQGYSPYYRLSGQEYEDFRCGIYYISFENE